jgi:hypothetical protein
MVRHSPDEQGFVESVTKTALKTTQLTTLTGVLRHRVAADDLHKNFRLVADFGLSARAA